MNFPGGARGRKGGEELRSYGYGDCVGYDGSTLNLLLPGSSGLFPLAVDLRPQTLEEREARPWNFLILCAKPEVHAHVPLTLS